MGLSEEEKKIIESINDYIKKKEELGDLGNDFTINFRDTKPLKTLLHLIENQQKEIEENQVLIDDIKEHRIVYIDTPEFEEKFISKDKIREKINQLKEIADEDNPYIFTKIDAYEELLEE